MTKIFAVFLNLMSPPCCMRLLFVFYNWHMGIDILTEVNMLHLKSILVWIYGKFNL